MTDPNGDSAGRPGVRQLRLVVEAVDFDEAVRFYRDVLAMREQAAFSGDGDARVVILEAGRATLELANPAQRRMIDDVEVGRAVSGPIRVAFEVDDAAAVTDALAAAGAAVLGPPVVTPWRSRNARLAAPADLQITVFEELESLDERAARAGFGTAPVHAAAIVQVRSVAASLVWYEAAGFRVRGTLAGDGAEPTWAEVQRGPLVVQLLAGDTPWEGPPAFTGSFYVPVASVGAVAAELAGRVEAPWGVEERPWGAVELVVRDPDGYVVTFTGGP